MITAGQQIAGQANANKNKDVFGSILYNVKAYGAKGDGVTDDTTKINATLADIKKNGGGTLFFPPGAYVLSGLIQVIQGSSINISIKGSGKWETVIRRSSGYPAGDLFMVDAANGSGASVLFEDLRIENAVGFNNTSGAAIHIKNTTTSPISINRVWIEDGYNGLFLDNCGEVFANEFVYIQSAPYAASYSSFAGCLVSGHVYNSFFVNSYFYGQNPDAANNLDNGILIRGADGLQLSNCFMSGKIGLNIQGGYSKNIDDIYVDNCIIDNVSTVCFKVSGTNAPFVFANIRVSNTHMNVGNRVGAQDVVQIQGDADYVQVIGNNINLGYGGGVYVDGSVSYMGGVKQSVQIIANDISENNLSNTGNTHGVSIAANSGGITIHNNKIRNRTAAGHQKYAIGIGTGCTRLNIQGNETYGNETGTILLGGSPTNSIIMNNLGVDDATTTVASAASITAPITRIATITGTTTINTISGGWPGRTIQIFPNDGTLILGTSGNILRGITLAQFQMVTLTMVGNNWIIN